MNLLAFFPAQTTTLQSALDQKMVKASVTANPNGTHYQNPMIIRLTNLTSVTQKIVIENGRTFQSDDPGYQPIIVVASTIIEIEPGTSKETYVQGMCFSQHLKSPSKAVNYCVGDVATGNLALITHYIQQNHLQGVGAQHAIWSITDSRQLEDIVDWDEAKAQALAEYVADIMGGTAPLPAAGNDYARNLRVVPENSVGGNFEYSLNETAQVNIGLFDRNGVIVRELYYNPTEQAGSHTIEYAFDASVYTDDYYVVKYLQNNQVIDERTVEL